MKIPQLSRSAGFAALLAFGAARRAGRHGRFSIPRQAVSGAKVQWRAYNPTTKASSTLSWKDAGGPGRDGHVPRGLPRRPVEAGLFRGAGVSPGSPSVRLRALDSSKRAPVHVQLRAAQARPAGRDDTGKPVAGARVLAAPMKACQVDSPPSRRSEPSVRDITLAGLPEGTRVLLVRADGFCPVPRVQID